MNWYEDNRSTFRNVFKGLTLISLAVALILCLIYALVPVSAGSSEITTIYDFVPLLCIPLSFFLAFRQLKTKREGDCFILDWIEMILSVIHVLLVVITILCLRFGAFGSNRGDPVMFRVSVGSIAILLTQVLLIYLFKPNSKPKETIANNSNPKE